MNKTSDSVTINGIIYDAVERKQAGCAKCDLQCLAHNCPDCIDVIYKERQNDE